MNRWRFAVVGIVISVVIGLGGCTPKSLPTGSQAVWDVVVIGDSSMWGVADVLGAKISEEIGVSVIVHDFSMSGLTAVEVKDVLITGKSQKYRLEQMYGVLKDAEVVVLSVSPLGESPDANPLDLYNCFSNIAPEYCTTDNFSHYSEDLRFIWLEISKMRGKQPLVLFATDLYNPLLTQWTESGVDRECTACWELLSLANRQVASDLNIPFISRLDTFNGPDHNENPVNNGYILEDGEHLSDTGVNLFVDLIISQGFAPVQLTP